MNHRSYLWNIWHRKTVTNVNQINRKERMLILGLLINTKMNVENDWVSGKDRINMCDSL